MLSGGDHISHLGMVTIPPENMVMTGGWFMIFANINMN